MSLFKHPPDPEKDRIIEEALAADDGRERLCAAMGLRPPADPLRSFVP